LTSPRGSNMILASIAPFNEPYKNKIKGKERKKGKRK
jgi:hypothetical protein